MREPLVVSQLLLMMTLA
jgi:hypothetical protein